MATSHSWWLEPLTDNNTNLPALGTTIWISIEGMSTTPATCQRTSGSKTTPFSQMRQRQRRRQKQMSFSRAPDHNKCHFHGCHNNLTPKHTHKHLTHQQTEKHKHTNISNINTHQQQIDLIEPNACTVITVNGCVPHATNAKNKRQRQRRRQKQMRQGALVCCATQNGAQANKPTRTHTIINTLVVAPSARAVRRHPIYDTQNCAQNN